MTIIEMTKKVFIELLIITCLCGMILGVFLSIFLDWLTHLNLSYQTAFMVLLCSVLFFACGLLVWVWGVLSRRHIRRHGNKSDMS